VNTGEGQSGDRKPMNPREQAVIAIVAAVTLVLLVFHPFDNLASFNPVEWLSDSVNGFFDWFINLFFGWLPF
jgi:hypothetical protein